jgi:hypothetical protein
MREELGDVLIQVVFHAQLAAEAGHFTLEDVAREVNEKLVRRHPHVFGDHGKLGTSADVLVKWEQIKAQEKRAGGQATPVSTFKALPPALPALDVRGSGMEADRKEGIAGRRAWWRRSGFLRSPRTSMRPRSAAGSFELAAAARKRGSGCRGRLAPGVATSHARSRHPCPSRFPHLKILLRRSWRSGGSRLPTFWRWSGAIRPTRCATIDGRLSCFAAWVRGSGLSERGFGGLGPRDLRDFVIESQRRWDRRTVHGHVSGLRAFFRFWQRAGRLQRSPLVGVPLPRLERRLPRFLTEASDGPFVGRAAAVAARGDRWMPLSPGVIAWRWS